MTPLERAFDVSALPSDRHEGAIPRRPGWGLWPSPADRSRLCLFVGIAFTVLTIVGAIVLGAALRSAALAQAGRNVDRLSGAAAEQVTRSMQAVDLMLQDISHRVESEASVQGVPVGKVMGSLESHRMLVEHAQHASQVASAALIDRHGGLMNWSRDYPLAPFSVAQRDFFMRAAAESGPPDLFISPPQISEATGRRTVFVARRLSDEQARFAGVALGTMPLDMIEGSLAALTRSPGVSVTLFLDDGRIVAHAPGNNFELSDVESSAGSKNRVASTRSLPPYDMRLVVSLTTNEALAPWRLQAVAIGIAAVAGSICVLAMMWALLRQIRAQRAAQDALSERNLDLEEANRRIERQALELAATAQALRANEALLADRSSTLNTTLEYIDQGILMVDSNEVVAVYNRRACEVLNIPQALLESRPLFKDLLAYQWEHGEFDRASQDLVAFIRAGGMVTAPHTYQRERPNGQVIEICSLPLPGGGIVRTFTDVTERIQAQSRIERAALFDELTGLPNRLSLRLRLDEHLRSQPEGVAVLYVNLDRFRLLNDARGHVTGDALLQAVAARLQDFVAASDMIARTGGDEFAVIHPIEPAQDNASELAVTILRRLSEPYVVDGRRLTITASIGVATASAGTTTEILLRNADIAMYRAKDGGRNQICRYEPAMAVAQQERFQIEQSLREALGTHALRLAYQPIISLDTNAIAGFEALLRWNDPVLGDISPGYFIPIAEATGLIMTLGSSALEWACDEAASWSKPYTVAVNLSPAQFQGDTLVPLVKSILDKSRLDPSRLELEVTEGMLLEDTGPVRETMFALRDLGVSLTLDDFGTGHAGLSYLRRFPFQKFKIDRSFVRNLGRAREADTIVEEMLLLARRLDLRVVAEGVELESQLEHLRQLGCTYVQGYLTGRPVFAEVARKL